ncbi:MAG: CusA/CzcA family heavy metal efflux RND transporter [Deltaproteobacteria bacterium]|nr:CusA/CzcA family heavy metal efflux RND transporter [Deltaproteobacteria bacterium]
MLDRILAFSIAHRVLVVLLTLAAAAGGAVALWRLPIDAVPDITNQQVQINATAPALSPHEIEKQVTFVIETGLAGIPGLQGTRSFSRNGFAQVTAVFDDGTDLYFARQQVTERLAAVRASLPDGVEPQMGPITTGLGEIYMWTVELAPFDAATATAGRPGWQPDATFLTPESEVLRSELERAAYLRTVQDWIIRPQMRGVAGVAGIDTNGGYTKQYQVQPDVQQLASYGLGFEALIEALERNNLSTGAGYVEHNGESYIVRASGRLDGPDGLRDIVVAEREGVPIRVRDVAAVQIGRELRTGSATENGEEVVLGTALMLVGANSRTVAAAVGARLAEVAASLPPDVRVKPVLDRSALVNATIHTVATNLIEGAALVVAVLFIMLGNIRAALITALAIPLSMLLTAIGMAETRISANLMSLGAIDFGLIVDGAVIIVENCLRRLAERQHALGRPLQEAERLEVIHQASAQVRSATAFGEAIIILVYVPVLFLTGIEGKMFRPMALTVIFALLSAFVLSLTFVPAMVALCIRGPVRERESRLVAWAKALYAPALRLALRARLAVLLLGVAAVGAAAVVFPHLGQEFAPTLSELDLVVMASRIPSTGLAQATAMQREVERALQQVPEAAFVFSRTGTPDLAADPMPPYLSDTFIVLKPRSEWPNPRDTKEDVRERVERILGELPGNAYEFTQPIEMRFNELLAGVRSDVAVKVFGDEFDVLAPVAARIAAALRATPGAADVRVEPVEGAPVLSIDVDRTAVSRLGLSIADVHDVIAIAVGGRRAGQIFEGDRRFDVVVRMPDAARDDLHALGHLPVPLTHTDFPRKSLVIPGGAAAEPVVRFAPLESLAELTLTEGPNQISRENGKRRIVVEANVRGRDLGSFVEDARQRIARQVALPAGVWLGWGGQFENLVAAKQRLTLVVPLCLALIFLLLYSSFGRVADALVVFSSVPLALSGGVLALWARELPFSISAAVGFIALSGVAVLNGLVLVTFINELRTRGLPAREAIAQGALTRLRPVLMTALVASLGFVPMALATGTGAEVQRPLATVVIGGLLTSTLLTLFVLPALCSLADGRAPAARVVDPGE